MDKSLLCEIMPIAEKAAPLIAKLLGHGELYPIIGLLGMLVNCDPTKPEELAQKLKLDPDLFAKLKNLEATHAVWLKSVQDKI